MATCTSKQIPVLANALPVTPKTVCYLKSTGVESWENPTSQAFMELRVVMQLL